MYKKEHLLTHIYMKQGVDKQRKSKEKYFHNQCVYATQRLYISFAFFLVSPPLFFGPFFSSLLFFFSSSLNGDHGEKVCMGFFLYVQKKEREKERERKEKESWKVINEKKTKKK